VIEEEAKTKWCPFARLGSSTSGLGGMNRFIRPQRSEDEQEVRCIGSACMAWRWHPKGTDPDMIAVRQYPDVPEPDEPDGGYCGLAGKP